ncbi:hypothetical protein TcYC6_0050350 [Trypanosoma cruzi]|nr:hypothetical protein TcYC6_0050350 [Trypanosoma cruzi]
MSFEGDAALHSFTEGGAELVFHDSQVDALITKNENCAVFPTLTPNESESLCISQSVPLVDGGDLPLSEKIAVGRTAEQEGHNSEERRGPLISDAEEKAANPSCVPNKILFGLASVGKSVDPSSVNATIRREGPTAGGMRHCSTCPESSLCAQSGEDTAIMGSDENTTAALKPQDEQEMLQWLGVKRRGDLLSRYLVMGSVAATQQGHGVSDTCSFGSKEKHVDPQMRNLLLQEVQRTGSRGRFPNKQIFQRKLVLLGHQEVGKTSLRKCFESEPYFLKKLPDVKTTTGVEVCSQNICVGEDCVQLILSDFAGQEVHHSHTRFLTDRSIFLLVWKISSVEQDFQSSGISVKEEERLYKWIAEVYAKFPRAKMALVATHLDELRVQGQRSVERILLRVEKKVTSFMQRIAATDPTTGKIVTNEIVGNFAVSCKTREFIATGGLRRFSVRKLSALLQFFAEVAHRDCMEDTDFPAAAIPGRHLKLLEMLMNEKKRFPEKFFMPLRHFIYSAVQFGVASDEELLQIARLMHSWNIIYLSNPYCLSDNSPIMLRPLWLSRLAAALFSYAQVIRTPLHLRSVIGRLEYTVSVAEAADMHLMSKGFLRWPLVRVLFRAPLFDILGHEPDDLDYTVAVRFLISLSLLYPVLIPCDELALLEEETPIDIEAGQPIVREPKITRYFVPSLSPYFVPDSLRRLAPVLFKRGPKLRFVFNLLPDEAWWRFQFRLHSYQQVVVLQEPCGALLADNKGDDDDDDDGDAFDEYRLLEADEEHNRWNDAMWLSGDCCRVFLYREGLQVIRVFSTETKPHAAESVLEDIERTISSLLEEYCGLQRTVQIECPEPNCNGWLMSSELLTGTKLKCQICKQMISTEDVVAFAAAECVEPRRSHCFSDTLLKEAGELLCFSLNSMGCMQFCEYLGLDHTILCGAISKDSCSTDGDEEVTPTEQNPDYMYALDKVVRAAMLRQLRERVEEEARRRRMLEPAPTALQVSF